MKSENLNDKIIARIWRSFSRDLLTFDELKLKFNFEFSKKIYLKQIYANFPPERSTISNEIRKRQISKGVTKYAIDNGRTKKRDLKAKRDLKRLLPRVTSSFKSPAPYEGFAVAPPRFSNKGRWIVLLYNRTTNVQRTMALSKYVLSVGLGYEIPKGFEVDHIDDNPLNDSWRNLQILSSQDNTAKYSLSLSKKLIEFTCPICRKIVRRRPFLRTREDSISTCSREHSYEVQRLTNNASNLEIVAELLAIMNKHEICVMPKRRTFKGTRIKRLTAELKLVIDFCASHKLDVS